jgi:hypothetical protein
MFRLISINPDYLTLDGQSSRNRGVGVGRLFFLFNKSLQGLEGAVISGYKWSRSNPAFCGYSASYDYPALYRLESLSLGWQVVGHKRHGIAGKILSKRLSTTRIKLNFILTS